MAKKNSKNNITNLLAIKAPVYSQKLTLGQRAADSLTKFAGSWTFISFFIIFLIVWMALNVYIITTEWDPYPFILLNLVLSTLAAIQAPVILMSQNREGQRERIRTEYDYSVNRKAEKEIRELQKTVSRIEMLLRQKKK